MSSGDMHNTLDSNKFGIWVVHGVGCILNAPYNWINFPCHEKHSIVLWIYHDAGMLQLQGLTCDIDFKPDNIATHSQTCVLQSSPSG